MIKALVFDFDGLILDTETPEYESWQRIFSEHGTSLPREVWVTCIGTRNTFDPYAYLEQQLGCSVDREGVRSRRTAAFGQALAGERVRPGVEAYLREARQRGLRIGLASSSGRDWVDGHLTRLGLISYFECIHTGDTVERAKPAPDLYLAALQCLGVRADEAIAFEDSPNGATAAVAAGMRCVIVPNGMTGTLPFPDGVTRISSMADVPLSQLVDPLA